MTAFLQGKWRAQGKKTIHLCGREIETDDDIIHLQFDLSRWNGPDDPKTLEEFVGQIQLDEYSEIKITINENNTDQQNSQGQGN